MIHHGDCLDVMAAMEPESVDAIVTDPPYGLSFMAKDWDAPGAVGGFPMRRSKALNTVNTRLSRQGGRQQQGLDFQKRQRRDMEMFQQSMFAWAEAAYRVAKPSAYLLAFGGTRTVHRMTVALEDAGWIIRDMLVWAYASGFPKSKASLKPAWEPIVMARKPGPLRELAIDACRIPGEPWKAHDASGLAKVKFFTDGDAPVIHKEPHDAGRWPANVLLTDPIFDGGWDGVVGGGEAQGSKPIERPEGFVRFNGTDYGGGAEYVTGGYTSPGYGDSGTYSRFFLLPRDSRSGALSGIIGTCHICGVPIAETPSTVRTPRPDTAPPSAVTPPNEQPVRPVSDAASPSPSPATATAPSPVATPPDGMTASTGSEDGSSTGSDTSGTTTSSWSEPPRDTASHSDQPARTAEQPKTSTDTTTTTAAPWMCARCADDAMHGRTLPPPRLIGREPQLDEPSYTRFLIIPKADRADREPVLGGLPEREAGTMQDDSYRWERDGKGNAINLRTRRANHHPTVKPTELMRHLVRLVTPPDGVVLDPFLGSGTTALAAEMEGFAWIGIEREAEYVAIAEARLNGTQRGLGLTA